MHKHTLFSRDLNLDWPQLRSQFGDRLFLLIDAFVAEHHGEILGHNIFESTFTVTGGEQSKCIENVQNICNWLETHQAERNNALVVMGGGSVSDLGGLVAALFKRGMRLIIVPTTLMSMVDAAVGGKNAVNSAAGKNMLGTFYPPDLILSDIKFLSSLTKKEILSGAVEMFKHALISGGTDWSLFCSWMKHGGVPTAAMIERSAEIKAQISSIDEKDHSTRMVLNFGHTVGHAIEAYLLQLNTPQTHGACVAMGMMVEIRVAIDMKLTSLEFGESLIRTIQQNEWFDASALPEFPDIASFLTHDKKIRFGRFNLIAFDSPGLWNRFQLADMTPIEVAYRTLKNK